MAMIFLYFYGYSPFNTERYIPLKFNNDIINMIESDE